jgi:hypothetical protein
MSPYGYTTVGAAVAGRGATVRVTVTVDPERVVCVTMVTKLVVVSVCAGRVSVSVVVEFCPGRV